MIVILSNQSAARRDQFSCENKSATPESTINATIPHTIGTNCTVISNTICRNLLNHGGQQGRCRSISGSIPTKASGACSAAHARGANWWLRLSGAHPV
jgi:hypothetical protein